MLDISNAGRRSNEATKGGKKTSSFCILTPFFQHSDLSRVINGNHVQKHRAVDIVCTVTWVGKDWSELATSSSQSETLKASNVCKQLHGQTENGTIIDITGLVICFSYLELRLSKSQPPSCTDFMFSLLSHHLQNGCTYTTKWASELTS